MAAGQLLLLKNAIQEYAWGSLEDIPHLLGLPETGAPQAEMWMGAHPRGPSEVLVGDKWQSLRKLFATDPEGMLGKDVAARFDGELPFLFKVLAVADPLSIQAHPTATQAQAGYDRENVAGIAVDAPDRNYRDAFAKPELVCALTPFRALCGFRPWAETQTLFSALGLTEKLTAFSHPGSSEECIEHLFRELLLLDGPTREEVLKLAEHGCRVGAPLEYLSACAVYLELSKMYPGDTGALTSLMMNYLQLRPGEAVFLEPGRLHAYLGGLAVEIMAASDNVLRAGLTKKHVDQTELLRILKFIGEPVTPLPGPGKEDLEWVYPTSAKQFELVRLELRDTAWRSSEHPGPEILFVEQGPVTVHDAGLGVLQRGDSVFVPAGSGPYSLSGRGTVFHARVPHASS